MITAFSLYCEFYIFFFLLQSSSGKRTLLLSDSVSKTLSNERKLIFENFKSIIIQKYENSSEKLIYDKIHESLLIVEDTEAKSSSQHNDDERGDVTNTMTKSQTGLWRAQDESQIYSNSEMNERNESGSLYISLNDKLRLTRAIWYLPNLNRKFIKKLLKNKEIGVSDFFCLTFLFKQIRNHWLIFIFFLNWLKEKALRYMQDLFKLFVKSIDLICLEFLGVY